MAAAATAASCPEAEDIIFNFCPPASAKIYDHYVSYAVMALSRGMSDDKTLERMKIWEENIGG